MYITCHIESFSHQLRAEAFEFFASEAAGLRISSVTDRSFALTVSGVNLSSMGSKHVLHHAHLVVSNFLIALNIASLGYFTWAQRPLTHPVYQVQRDASEKEAEFVAITSLRSREYTDLRVLSDLEVENAIIIFGMLTREISQKVREEYVKGLIHFGLDFADVSFFREAFWNFFRSFEYFVTKHVLGQKRLNNEMKDMQRALSMLGAGPELNDALKEVYSLRSSQVAHAQAEQADITQDDVIKAKTFADLVMYKTYRNKAEELRSSYGPDQHNELS